MGAMLMTAPDLNCDRPVRTRRMNSIEIMKSQKTQAAFVVRRISYSFDDSSGFIFVEAPSRYCCV